MSPITLFQWTEKCVPLSEFSAKSENSNVQFMHKGTRKITYLVKINLYVKGEHVIERDQYNFNAKILLSLL